MYKHTVVLQIIDFRQRCWLTINYVGVNLQNNTSTEGLFVLHLNPLWMKTLELLNWFQSVDVPYNHCTKFRSVNVTSFTFQRWFCPFIIFSRNAKPFLRYSIVVPYLWLWFSKTFGLVLQHDRKIYIEFQVTLLKVKVIYSLKQTIISSAIAMNVFNVKTSYFIFQR